MKKTNDEYRHGTIGQRLNYPNYCMDHHLPVVVEPPYRLLSPFSVNITVSGERLWFGGENQ